MILADAGPIVALLDADDSCHSSCTAAVSGFPVGPLVTTWPCFTEAMYLLGRTCGHRYQAALWKMRSEGGIVLLDLSRQQADRMATLMKSYSNVPMDLADASLVVVAESSPSARIFTLDSDFYVYRKHNGGALDVVSGSA